MNKNSTAVTASLLLLGLLISGCGKAKNSGEADPTMTIGMMPKLVGIGYFDATQQGAEEAARELGIRLIHDGPTEARSEDQVRMINTWLARGIDALAIAPNDPEAVSRTLKEAGELGTSVLTWDTDANPTASERKTFVNQVDNEELAAVLVQLMVEGIRGKGETLEGDYLIVSGTATASNQNTWMDLMSRIIRRDHPEINLLQHLTPGEDQQRAYEQTTEALAAHPDLKGIWGITSVALPAAAKACLDGDREEVYVTGLSLPSLMRESIQNGSVEKFALWDAVDLGYLTVHAAYALHSGELRPGRRDFGRLKNIDVRDGQILLGPPLILDRNNIDQYQF